MVSRLARIVTYAKGFERDNIFNKKTQGVQHATKLLRKMGSVLRANVSRVHRTRSSVGLVPAELGSKHSQLYTSSSVRANGLELYLLQGMTNLTSLKAHHQYASATRRMH